MAVDGNGGVFVGTIYGIYEFANGLSGCNSTLLNSQLYEDQAMVADANNDLIVSEGQGEVAVIAPPYTTVTRTIGSGFYFGEGLSINKKNKLVYVASVNNDSLIIINYQTGQNVKVLSGGALGISRLFAVVDGPNYVP